MTKQIKHWTDYLLPFGPCCEGFRFARRFKTIESFWSAVTKRKNYWERNWLAWLWCAVAYQDPDFTDDLRWATRAPFTLTVSDSPRDFVADNWWKFSNERHPARAFRCPTLTELKAAHKRAVAWLEQNKEQT